MRRDHRPYWMKAAGLRAARWYARQFIEPQFDALGEGAMFYKPRHIRLQGPRIRAGRFLHVIAQKESPVTLCTGFADRRQGALTFGDYCLVCPGVRMSSASGIELGDNCMVASNCYLTDADWHDVYDRTDIIGRTAPIRIEDNVWLGDGVIVAKGVTIGRNSIVGTRAVVLDDIPADCIAAGNPARVVRELDREAHLGVRAALFQKSPRELDRINAYLDGLALDGNTLVGWLRATLSPRESD